MANACDDMGRVLVLYESISGNTRKMAEMVAQGATHVPHTEVRLRHVREASAEDVVWCDGLAVGSPTHLGVVSSSMSRFWEDLVAGHWGKLDGRLACAFSSSGGWGGGGELTCMSILTMMINYGFLVFGVPDYPGNRLTLHYGAVVAGSPTASEEMRACELLGERLAQWVAVMRDGRMDAHPRGSQRTPREGSR